MAGVFGYNGFLCGLALGMLMEGSWYWSTIGAVVLNGTFSTVGNLLRPPFTSNLSGKLLNIGLGNLMIPTFKLPPFTLAFNVATMTFLLAAYRFEYFVFADNLGHPQFAIPQAGGEWNISFHFGINGWINGISQIFIIEGWIE
jgi:urea transporter